GSDRSEGGDFWAGSFIHNSFQGWLVGLANARSTLQNAAAYAGNKSPQTFSKYVTHSFRSSIVNLCSYSIENTGLIFWRFTSVSMPFTSPRPVPHGTSRAPLPNSFRSFMWKEMMRPSSFFKHSTGFKSERIQWPVSQQAPMRLLWSLTCFNTISGSQYG